MASIHFPAVCANPSESFPARRNWLAVLLCTLAFTLPFTPILFQSADAYGLPAKRPAPGFRLFDSAGDQRSLADFSGKFVYLMFGYLNCTDICHTQAFTFQELDRFAGIDRDIAFVFVSIDPQRDDAARLAAYFDQRGENFTSLSSKNNRYLQALALDYNGYFYREAGGEAESYGISHAGYYYLIDPDGRIRYTYSPAQRQLHSLIGDLMAIENEYKQRLKG